MPNWCRNQLVVKGDYDAMREWFLDIKPQKDEDGKEYYQIIQSVFPAPKELMSIESYVGDPSTEQVAAHEKYGVSDWYQWQRKFWGVKWGDCNTKIEYQSSIMYELQDDPEQEFDADDKAGEHYIRYRFDTAWAPPIKAFERISKMFPTLHFHLKYVESGVKYKGETTFDNGVVNNVDLEYIPEWDDDYV